MSEVYAVCSDCGVDLPTPQDAHEHSQATMTPTGATSGVTARGHGYRVINPTPEEKARRIVDREVGDAMEQARENAFEGLDREIRAGRITEGEVSEHIRYYDGFADEWAEWVADGAR